LEAWHPRRTDGFNAERGFPRRQNAVTRTLRWSGVRMEQSRSATLRLLAGGKHGAQYAREHVSLSEGSPASAQNFDLAESLRPQCFKPCSNPGQLDRKAFKRNSNPDPPWSAHPGQLHWSAGVRRLSKHDCSGCFRLERLPGGACTHWKAPPCHGAHVKQPLLIAGWA
jgi:hypothetical protein